MIFCREKDHGQKTAVFSKTHRCKGSLDGTFLLAFTGMTPRRQMKMKALARVRNWKLESGMPAQEGSGPAPAHADINDACNIDHKDALLSLQVVGCIDLAQTIPEGADVTNLAILEDGVSENVGVNTNRDS